MEVKIGIQHAPREVSVDTDESAELIEKNLRAALSGDGLLTLNDKSGRTVLIPVAGIAYLDFGQAHARPVGFGSV